MSLKTFGKKSYIGLDLGAKGIKAMQMERTGNGYRVARTAFIQTPPDSIKDGSVIDPEAVGLAVRQMMREQRISATNAVVGVAGASVIVRTVRIPKMPESTLRKSIKFEASRYVPSSIEDSFIEFEIMGEASDGQMDVLIVAAPRDIVESRIKACQIAGLEVDIVDVEAFAMYRSLVETNVGPYNEETIALVDVGAQTTNVSVVSCGIFGMTRSINQGGQVLTDALKSHFKLEDAEAELGKSQLDLRALIAEQKVQESPPLRVLQPHLDDLIREIRRSLNYYQSQQTEHGTPTPVTRVLLAGGGANLPGLAEYMAHKLGLTVDRHGIYDAEVVQAPADNQSTGIELAVVGGLAMRPHVRAA